MKRLVCTLLVVFLLLGLAVPAAGAGEARSGDPVTHFILSVGETPDGLSYTDFPAEVTIYRNGIRVATVHVDGRYYWEVPDIGTYTVRLAVPSGYSIFSSRIVAPGIERQGTYREFTIEVYGPYAANITWWLMAAAPSTPFTDVRPGQWFYDAVAFVYDKEIMTGTTGTTFSPGTNFNREQLVATLFRIEHGRPAIPSDSRESPFVDVPTGRWSAPYIAWAARTGIVEGTTPTTFAPGNPITRQNTAVMLYRFAERSNISTDAPPNQAGRFTDARLIGSWATDEVNWAIHHGLLQGAGGILNPAGTTNRAQAATLLERFITTFDVAIP